MQEEMRGDHLVAEEVIADHLVVMMVVEVDMMVVVEEVDMMVEVAMVTVDDMGTVRRMIHQPHFQQLRDHS